MTGGTSSIDFPTTAGAFDTSFNGAADAFVTELNPAGSALLYSTYLGGANSDIGNDLALNAGRNVYVTGHTYAIDFPTTAGAFDTVFNGDPVDLLGRWLRDEIQHQPDDLGTAVDAAGTGRT